MTERKEDETFSTAGDRRIPYHEEMGRMVPRPGSFTEMSFKDMDKALTAIANTAPAPNDPGYAPLRAFLDEAFLRASQGKGKERHANGFPFLEQPLFMIMRGLGPGGVNGAIFQAIKKLMEIKNLKPESQVAELMDVVVYAAAAAIYLREIYDASTNSHPSKDAGTWKETNG